MLSFDEFIDAKSERGKAEKFLTLERGFQNFENAIRILSGLFKKEDFWEKFSDLKKEYFQTILFEKKISKEKLVITQDIFYKIARGKSAIILNSVYALQLLGNTFENELELRTCINEIHIALQYVDDVEDFKIDAAEGQWTYPQHLVRDFKKKNDIEILEGEDVSLSHKYLYLSGVSDILFQSAINHFSNALKISDKFGLTELSNYLKSKIRSIEFHLNEISFLKNKAMVKSQKSNDFVTENSLERAVINGVNYLKENLESDLTWIDFMTSAGPGKAWTTTFIAFQLVGVKSSSSLLQMIGANISENPDNFLSYNRAIIQDGDSTNFLIGFLLKSEGRISSYMMNSWTSFYDSTTGGWKTYIDEKKLRSLLELEDDISVRAWLSPKVCVSAVSAYILSHSSNKVLYNKTCSYLVENLKGNRWDSYWWTSSVYATSFAIMALVKSEEFKKFCDAPINWLISQQIEDGCWLNPFDKSHSPFYTALAIKALIVYDFLGFKHQIGKGIKWLMLSQTLDGSWKTCRILQIPGTDVLNPVDVKKWRSSSFGVNCVSDDFNRVFTTSVVVNCLEKYKENTHAY